MCAPCRTPAAGASPGGAQHWTACGRPQVCCLCGLFVLLVPLLMCGCLCWFDGNVKTNSNLSYCRSLASAQAGHPAQAGSRNGGSGSSSSSSAGKKASRRGSEKEPQPQLQDWLKQEQGLQAADADQYARHLALVFGSQQAALHSLPATFEWCRSRGLSGLETAQLLDRIAFKRQDSVVQFAALVQPVWQLLDSHITAYVEPLRQAGARLPKHTSLAGVLRGKSAAAEALGMPPGHVEAWLAAVGERLPAAAVGRLLTTHPEAVVGSPATALAAISWVVTELGAADPAGLIAASPSLLAYEAATLQRNLDSLQQAAGATAEAAQRLVLKQPRLLMSSTETVQVALAWLRQLFSDADQLADVIDRGSRLLGCSEQHLQANADYLRQAQMQISWQMSSTEAHAC